MNLSSLLEKYSVKKRLIMLTVISNLLFLVLVPLANMWQLDKKLTEQKELIIKGIVGVSHQLVIHYQEQVDKGEMTEEDAKKAAMEEIKHLSYDNGAGYVWINDFNNVFIMHPVRPELVGQNWTNKADKNGVKLISDLTKETMKNGNGIVEYYWPKKGQDNQLSPKMSYGEADKKWGWVIGSGAYIDDINHEVFLSLIVSIIINLIASFIIIVFVNMPISASIISPIEELTAISKKIADNDLQVDIPEDNNHTEIGDLRRSFKHFIKNFRGLVKRINQAVEEVSVSADQMNVSAEQTAFGAQQVAQTIGEMATGSQEQAKSVYNSLDNIKSINRKVKRISDGAESTVEIAKATENTASAGKDQAHHAVNKVNQLKNTSVEISKTINELGTLSSEIVVIVDLIKGIAGQTNLLALNAAIEAARAGEHGKGFAVVAEEVKKLATESASATDKITEMIKDIQNKTNLAVITMDEAVHEVEDSVTIVDNVGKALENILHSAKDTNEQITSISDEISRLASNSEELAKTMENISAISEESAASAEEVSSVTEEQTASLEEISASTHALANIAKRLQEIIRVFKA